MKSTTFTELMQAVQTAQTEKEKGQAITRLAQAIAVNVLKKLVNAGGCKDVKYNDITTYNKYLHRLYGQLQHDIALENNTQYINTISSISYTKKGKIKDITSKADREAIKAISKDSYTESADLISIAKLAILEQLKAGREDLERPYNIRRVKKDIHINLDSLTLDSDKVFEWKQTTPIQEIYKTVRRYIYSQNKDYKDTYNYIPIDIIDSITGETATVYARYIIAVDSVDSYIELKDSFNLLCERCKATATQKDIAYYKLRGYSLRQIAEKRKCSHNAVIDSLNKLAQRAQKAGYSIK